MHSMIDRVKSVHIASIVGILTYVCVMEQPASAQVLSMDTRCGNTAISPSVAAPRYAWALNCRNNVPPIPVGVPMSNWRAISWLTTDSITDYEDPFFADIKPLLFPVYYYSATGGNWDAPTDPAAPCSLRPWTHVNIGLCTAGCYLPDTALQFAEGSVDIKTAAEQSKIDLITLAPTATFDHLQFTQNTVQRYSADAREDWQTIYTFTMESGGSLQVTSEHPLLTSDGIIHQARSLRKNDELVLASGQPDPIVKVSRRKMFTKVYNVKPVTIDYTSNIVVAGGYLNGSARYQNEYLDMINSLILRRAISDQIDQF